MVWLKLKNMTFTLPLMNESSALYQKTQHDVINEVRDNRQCYHNFEKSEMGKNRCKDLSVVRH